MISKVDWRAIEEVRSLSEHAKSQIDHVVGNATAIISGCAQLLMEHTDDTVRARARAIYRTCQDLNNQKRILLRPDVDAHLGSINE